MKLKNAESLYKKVALWEEQTRNELLKLQRDSYEYKRNNFRLNAITEFKHMVFDEPVAYDLDAVLNELDKLRAKPMELVYDIPLIDHIYEIVRKGGKK